MHRRAAIGVPEFQHNVVGEGVPTMLVSPDQSIAAIFSTQTLSPNKTRSCQCPHDNAKVDATYLQ